MSAPFVVLIHGFNKDRDDMQFLENKLQEAGFNVYVPQLPTRFETLDAIVGSLHQQIESLVSEADSICYVAHSMGGLITRKYISQYGQEKVDKCVFIATPHSGSRLADIAGCIPGYATLFKPIVNLMTTSGYVSFANSKQFKIGVIAGNRVQGVLGHLFLTKNSDGQVEVESAMSDDADDVVVVPFGHKEIHHQSLTARLTIDFLKTGRFSAEFFVQQPPGL